MDDSGVQGYRTLISIHALLAESDGIPNQVGTWEVISIHALLAESDTSFTTPRTPSLHFYPRSPCGERPAGNKAGAEAFKFLSTLSLRRATTSLVVIGTNCVISIHALLAESDAAGRFLLS